jgi:hypothetical protein
VDPRERELDPEETIRLAFEGMIARVWCAMPGVLQAVTNNGNTCEVQPAVNGRVRQLDGSYKSIQIPKLVDVPICWQGGGGATWTFPLKATVDEGLLVLASRCIDQWWANGYTPPAGQIGADGKPVNTLNDPPEFRMHNLSDGFFIPGVRSKARAFSTFDTTTARLRTDDDTCYIEFDPVNKKVNIVAPGGITANGVTIDSTGHLANAASVAATGNITSGATVAAQTSVTVGGTPLTVP